MDKQRRKSADRSYLMIRYMSDNVNIPPTLYENEYDDYQHDDGDDDDDDDEYDEEENAIKGANYNDNIRTDTTNNKAGTTMNTSSNMDESNPIVAFERSKSSITAMRRHSSFIGRKKVPYENTYRMEPKLGQHFVWWKVRNAIVKLMNPVFESFKYDAKTAATMCKLMASKCMSVVKRRFDCPRHRYVCNVTLVQLRQQGIMIGDRSLWNTAYDNYAVCVFKNRTAVCVITLHGLYLE
ncbi:unnamed protein product [Lymnaea stagnalis]|uniref:Uncharacterized protein n=1 Tax=Lymnaea stagnalis TaxID=6523 RepID=A0AAV2HTJ1_LYMST